MYNKYVTYIGCDDNELDLFEGMYPLPYGISYNSYVLRDKKIAVMDTVDKRKAGEWLDKLAAALGADQPDYLIVHHVEPDHSSSIKAFLDKYPGAVVVGNAKTFTMLAQFYGEIDNKKVVTDGEELPLGDCSLKFIFAPMVHWPEVMVSYEPHTKSLFAADAFGTFGSFSSDQPWEDEARRYYYNIVGKYGVQVQKLLAAASGLDIRTIFSLHGPILDNNIGYYFDLYNKWSRWQSEEQGVVIACAGAHGNTVAACEKLKALLEAKGQTVKLYDLSRIDLSFVVAEAFKYDKLVLGAITYYAEIFPAVEGFLTRLLSKGYVGRTVGLIENGTWAAQSGKKMQALLSAAKDITMPEPMVSLGSALSPASEAQLTALAEALAR